MDVLSKVAILVYAILVLWNTLDVMSLQNRVDELEKAVAPVEFESLDDVMYNLGEK